jgi:hypothetical protein
MTNDMTSARDQAAQDICDATLKATQDVMRLHGNDPRSSDIIAAGLVMAIVAIGEPALLVSAMLTRALAVR